MKSVEKMRHYRPLNSVSKKRIDAKEVYVYEKLSEYLSGIPFNGKLGFLSNGATFVKISEIHRLGGVSNDVYSFLLTYRDKEREQHSNLVLKTYGKAIDPVLRTYFSDENFERCVKEFQVLQSLERVGFPAPKACLCERNSSVLGYPFIIMQKVEPTQNSSVRIDYFANTLARLHSLDIPTLGISVLKVSEDGYEFANRCLLYLKRLLSLSPGHGKGLKKDFEFAIRWLESNVSRNRCPKYCLLHGDYRANLNTFLTKDSGIVVIDWEDAEIGDPAYDVGIAYIRAQVDFGKKTADRFVQEYMRYFDAAFAERLFFYKLMGILRLAIFHDSVLSNPLRAYEIRGINAFLSFPFLRLPFIAKRTGADLDAIWVECFKEFVGENLRR
jgi:aminoglycoside phosphotransferase (APT) family kinase protein